MTKASPQRRFGRSLNSRFQGKANGHTAIAQIPGAFPDVQLGDLNELKKAITEANMLRTAMEYMVNDIQRLIYETERNEAVTLRLMQSVSKGPSMGLIVGGGQSRSFSVDDLLDLKNQYLAEYDAICALIALITTHG